MKAMVLKTAQTIEKNPLELMEVPVPTPAQGEIRIKISACGICHTDLHTVEGELPLMKRLLIPGHQIVGRVEHRGEGAYRFQIGDRVGVPWLYSTCGKCEFCLKGRENLCENARFTGYHVDGGYAESMVVHENFAYPLPEKFSDVEAAPLLCAGIIGYRSLRLSEIKPGERLGLYGFGASAHIVIQVARHRNCEVYVFTRSALHCELAQKLGAVWTGDAKDNPPHKLDSAIIFAPAGSLVLDGLRALKKGGTLALAGIYMSPIPEIEYDLIYHEKILRSVANTTRQDAEEFLKIAAQIPVKTKIETFPLEKANLALQLLKQGKISGAGVLVVK
jgi:propanol-preferring alcohol dehydrogenase